MNEQRCILILEAATLPDITTQMAQMAQKTLSDKGIEFVHVRVPSCLELAPTIRYAIRSMEMKATEVRYIGYITLGAMKEQGAAEDEIETAMHFTTALASQYSLAVGQGLILGKTEKDLLKIASETAEQAAQTCIDMMDLKKRMGLY